MKLFIPTSKVVGKSRFVIFTNIGSTTFTYALSTNIPIILFENKKNENWNTCI